MPDPAPMPAPISPLAISHFTLSNALGFGKAATLNALLERHSGLKPCDFLDVALDTYIGRVADLENQPVREGIQ